VRLKGIGVGNEGASDGGCSCASALVVSRERLEQNQQERFEICFRQDRGQDCS